jgi:hypothetical protein
MLVTVDIPENNVPFMMELLKNLNFTTSKDTKLTTMKVESIEKGQFGANEKPSDFAGIWKNEKRDFKQLRASAWKQK